MIAIQRILLPVDFSPGSRAAIDLGLYLGRTLGAAMTVFHAYLPPHAMVAIVPGVTVEGDQHDESEALGRDLDAIAAELRAGSVADANSMFVVGVPKQAILEHARAGRFDLIVMGTHGRTGLSRLVLGSVAEHVVRHAECPVVTVHGPRS